MLKGTLDDFTLPDIFRLLSMAKRTGTLEVTRSAGSGKVFFRSGDVYFAQSSLTREPLGQKLIRARAITEGQLMRALDEHASGGRRVGEILVASELVSLEQLEIAVREQIEDSVFDLLRWELGEFEWEPGAEAEVEVPIAVSVENLIMEASRRLDELEVIHRKIPGVHAVLRMAPKPPEDAVEINITPAEWRILVLIDGTRSVAEIAEAVSLDEFGAMRVLYGLVAAGLIELSPESAALVVEPETEPETELPEAVEVAAPEAEAAIAEETPDEPVFDVAEEQPAPAAFSLAVDLSPHPNGDDSPPPPPAELAELAEDEVTEAAEVAAEVEDAPAFAPVDELPDDLSDELSESLIAHLSADGAIDLATEPDMPVEAFDQPAPDELSTALPLEDAPTPGPEASAEPLAADTPPVDDEVEQPTIDRAAVVRELAGLFSDDERPRAQRAAADPGRPTAPHRIEDDDQITKGLISRLIDGVKGL